MALCNVSSILNKGSIETARQSRVVQNAEDRYIDMQS